jgi:two-component system, LytTR family, response regulator
MNLRVLIVDDEELVRRSVRRFLANHEIESIVECTDGQQALEAIRRDPVDLAFMDIQMPKMTGMDVIAKVGIERMPTTILITAHTNYAVEAFNFNVVDYLLKPFGRERFDRAVARARQWIRMPEQTEAMPSAHREREQGQFNAVRSGQQYAERMAIPRNGRISLIETSEIEWIEAQGNLVLIHCARQSYELRRPLIAIQKQLDPKIFVRLHRSTLVNVRFIREIQPWFNGYHLVVLKNGRELRMSRYQQEEVEYLMGSPFCLR